MEKPFHWTDFLFLMLLLLSLIGCAVFLVLSLIGVVVGITGLLWSILFLASSIWWLGLLVTTVMWRFNNRLLVHLSETRQEISVIANVASAFANNLGNTGGGPI